MSYENVKTSTPSWASILGVVTIMLGVFLTALHANEVVKQIVITNNMPVSGEMPSADCPEEELEEEGISVAECEYFIDHVKGLALAAPDWFPGIYITLAAMGAILAFISIIIGGALVNYAPWASKAALFVFSGLVSIDLLQFATVVNTGPTLREAYLGNILLWFVLHLSLLIGAIAGKHTEAGT